MGDLASKSWMSFGGGPSAPRASRRGFVAGLTWLAGAVATVAAVTIGAVLTVVFAATVAVIFVLLSALIAISAVAFRTRRQPQGVLIEARKVGHSWVAYGWDQRPR